MRSFGLLLLALISIILFSIPLFIYQTLVNIQRGLLSKFFEGLALALDYVGAYLIFGVRGHTISALVYHREIKWAIRGINWLFQDELHCEEQYNDEFIKIK